MSHDAELKSAVLAELKWEPSVDAAHVGVTAKDGVISLMGHVGSYVEKHGAEKAAGRVTGVKAVAEELEVRLPYSIKHSDEDIAKAGVNRLAWNSAIPRDAVKLKVENGWVTLSGSVEWNFQKDAAKNDIRWLYGVVGVSNDIMVKPVANAANISKDINHALHRSWFFNDPQTVHVTAIGGDVKLTGTVDSWWDRQTAGATAWAAPGAASVQNDIRVN
ncbi:MAG: BON domain-containing protein [Alphaproteobacteria bacterium]